MPTTWRWSKQSLSCSNDGPRQPASRPDVEACPARPRLQPSGVEATPNTTRDEGMLSLSLLLFELVTSEVEGAGVLGNRADGGIREAVAVGGADLDGDLDVGAHQAGQVLDDLLGEPPEVAVQAGRVERHYPKEAL